MTVTIKSVKCLIDQGDGIEDEVWIPLEDVALAIFADGIIPPPSLPDPADPGDDPDPTPPGIPQAEPTTPYGWLDKYHPRYAKTGIFAIYMAKAVEDKAEGVPVFVDSGKKNGNGAHIFIKMPSPAIKLQPRQTVFGYRHIIPIGKPEDNNGFPTADGQKYAEICSPHGHVIPSKWLTRIAIIKNGEPIWEPGYSEDDMIKRE